MTDHGASNDAGSGPPPRGDKPAGSAREAAWDEVAAQFSRLGQRVRERFDRPAEEAPGASEPSAEDAPGTPGTREGSGGDSVRRWIDTLDDTFTKLGDTVRDPAFRKEAGASVGRLGEALGVTLRELGEQMQGRFGRRTEPSAGESMPDVPPPPSSAAADAPSPSSTPDAPTPPASDVTPPPTAAQPEPDAPATEVPPPPPADTELDEPEDRPPHA